MRGLASLARPREERTINDADFPWISLTKDGQQVVTEEQALNLSAVWACQTLIADSIATLPVDTYRKRDNIRVPTDPPGWLERPNPETRHVDFETQRVLSLLGWGNAYALLIRRSGSSDPLDPVIERWMLDPAAVYCDRDANRRLVYSVLGVPVPAGNIHHVRGYTLPGRVEGLSVITHARLSMGLTSASEEFGNRFYTNGIMPSGVLRVPQLPSEVSKDVVERLREQFASRYAGTGNTGKPLVLTGGTEWTQVTINPVDAQFLDTRKFQIEEICRWYRCPPHKVQQIIDNASQGGGNGLEQMDIGFARDTLRTWTIRLEEADSELVPRGQYVRLNTDAYVRADLKTRYEAHKMAREGGWASADDIRALEDEPPLPNGKGTIYLQPSNYIEAGTQAPAPPATVPPTGDDD